MNGMHVIRLLTITQLIYTSTDRFKRNMKRNDMRNYKQKPEHVADVG